MIDTNSFRGMLEVRGVASPSPVIAPESTNETPVERRTIYDVRSSPLSLASQLDVDRILAIFDQAESGDTEQLFALYRDILVADAHLQTEFGKRLLAVLGDPLTIQSEVDGKDDDDPAVKAVREMVTVPGWMDACAFLMAGTLWPVAVVEKVYEPAPGGYALKELVPVPFELLDFTRGRLMIRQTDPVSGQRTALLLEPDPARYIVHRGHLLPTPDFWGGPFRSLVFWWFLSALNRDSWGRFIERFGSPFLVGKYDQADDASRGVLETAFATASKLFGLVISRETEVEIQQAAAQPTGEAFQLFHDVANREKSKLILGQTMSAEAQSTGIGQGASPQQETVRQDIRQFDAARLGSTLCDQLAEQYLRINGIAGCVKFIWGGESSEQASQTGDLLSKIKLAGLQVTDEGLQVVSERLGLPIERVIEAAPMKPGLPAFSAGLLALAAEALKRQTVDRMAGDAPAGLARRFRAGAAPIRDLVDGAQSPEELLTAIRALSIGWDPASTAQLLEEALLTYAANGAVVPLS